MGASKEAYSELISSDFFSTEKARAFLSSCRCFVKNPMKHSGPSELFLVIAPRLA